MSRITKEEVDPDVRAVLSTYTSNTIAPSKMKPEWVLTGPPLRFDSTDLGYIAMSLRGYVKRWGGDSKTIKAPQIRKSGTTLQNVIDLVWDQVK